MNPRAPIANPLALANMWGSTARIQFTSLSTSNNDSQQLAQVPFPLPVAAAIYFNAQIEAGLGTVQALTLDLFLGLGRTTVKHSLTWPFQPTIGAPLQVSLPSPGQPISALQAVVSGVGSASGSQNLVVACTLQVSGLGPLNMARQPLRFAMATEGEADELDTRLRRNAETEPPGVAGVDGFDDPDGFDGREDEEHTAGYDPDEYEEDDGFNGVGGVGPQELAQQKIDALMRRMRRRGGTPDYDFRDVRDRRRR